jgi:hypothetical protein
MYRLINSFLFNGGSFQFRISPDAETLVCLLFSHPRCLAFDEAAFTLIYMRLCYPDSFSWHILYIIDRAQLLVPLPYTIRHGGINYTERTVRIMTVVSRSARALSCLTTILRRGHLARQSINPGPGDF